MSAVRVIHLPNGRSCTVGTYVRAWKALQVAEAKGSKALFPGFFDWPEPAPVILSAMRAGMHDRINQHIPYEQRGNVPTWEDVRDAEEHLAEARSQAASETYLYGDAGPGQMLDVMRLSKRVAKMRRLCEQRGRLQ